ncbi:TPA: preprotein translocase subunit SecG [Patescibacteria group bacterium]|nr:preprotein translocase subunit SecG [Patescibacteria group bacterium]
MESLITFLQIVVSIVLITLILIQERSSGAGGAFGGGGGGLYQSRRGLEKVVFISTIVLVILFAGLALLNLVLPIQ